MNALKAVVRAKLDEKDITNSEIQALFNAGYQTEIALRHATPSSLVRLGGLSLGAIDLILRAFPAEKGNTESARLADMLFKRGKGLLHDVVKVIKNSKQKNKAVKIVASDMTKTVFDKLKRRLRDVRGIQVCNGISSGVGDVAVTAMVWPKVRRPGRKVMQDKEAGYGAAVKLVNKYCVHEQAELVLKKGHIPACALKDLNINFDSAATDLMWVHRGYVEWVEGARRKGLADSLCVTAGLLELHTQEAMRDRGACIAQGCAKHVVACHVLEENLKRRGVPDPKTHGFFTVITDLVGEFHTIIYVTKIDGSHVLAINACTLPCATGGRKRAAGMHAINRLLASSLEKMEHLLHLVQQ